MMLSRKALAGYDRLLAGACGVASSQFQTLMLLWLADNPGADPDDLRREAMRVALDVLPASGDAVAQVAHRLCVALASQESEDAGRVKVGVSYVPDVDALDEAFRRAPSADPLGSMASAVADDVHRGANEQMGVSAEALGATGLALVPVGDIRTCEFCVARAAEGFHLPKRGSKTLAKSHDHCRCKVVPGFGADPRVEGHDVAFYRGLHALAGDLAHRGYSHRQIRDAMAGTPVEELGPPNSGVGGRPRGRSLTKEDVPRVRSVTDVVYESGGATGDPIKPGVYDPENFRNHHSEWRDVFAYDMLSMAGFKVIVREPSAPDGFSNIDILLDGELWEIKSPELREGGQKPKPGSELSFVEGNLDKAYKQFHRQWDGDTGGRAAWYGPIRVVLNTRYRDEDDAAIMAELEKVLRMKSSKFEVIMVGKDGSMTRLAN